MDNMLNLKGWICPKCGNVYAPFTRECYNCNSMKERIKKTNNSPTDASGQFFKGTIINEVK